MDVSLPFTANDRDARATNPYKVVAQRAEKPAEHSAELLVGTARSGDGLAAHCLASGALAGGGCRVAFTRARAGAGAWAVGGGRKRRRGQAGRNGRIGGVAAAVGFLGGGRSHHEDGRREESGECEEAHCVDVLGARAGRAGD